MRMEKVPSDSGNNDELGLRLEEEGTSLLGSKTRLIEGLSVGSVFLDVVLSPLEDDLTLLGAGLCCSNNVS